MRIEQYSIRSVNEVFDMASHLAQYFLNSAEVVTGIHELLMNAIEHGNLGIGYALKTQLLQRGEWETEIAMRSVREPYATRLVSILLRMDDGATTLCIRDGGDGFDWSYFAQREIVDATYHGRGLKLAQQCGFISLAFNTQGNEVSCRGEASTAQPVMGRNDGAVAYIPRVVQNF